MATVSVGASVRYSYSGVFGGHVTAGQIEIDLLATPLIATPLLDSQINVSPADDLVEFVFTVPLPASEKAALDALVAAHGLSQAKVDKFDAIDARTRDLIFQGFTFAGLVFSLSENSQRYWVGGDDARSDLSSGHAFPLRINTLDDLAAFDIPDADTFHLMYLTAVGTIKAHLGSGTALKDLVRAAKSVAEVDAVVDTR